MVRLRFELPSLPKAEKRVAEYLLENHEGISSMTLALLSQETASSEASIVRLCRRLGFDGFTAMKQAFMIDIIDSSETVTEDITLDDSLRVILQKVIDDNINTLTDTLALITPQWEGALDVLCKAKSIHFFGAGDAHAVCQLAHVKFSRLGITGTCYSDVTMQLIAAATLSEGDVAIAVSYSGSSRTTTQATRVAKEAGATTIAITRMNKSPLVRCTDYQLYIATTDRTVSRQFLSRRIADQAILDALYLGVLVRGEKTYDKILRSTQKAIDNDKL